MPLPNDPVGSGTDMSQWQNWLMSMLQAQPVPPQPSAPGYAGSSGAGSGDPRAQDAAMNRMTGMAPGVTNPGYVPPGITPGAAAPPPVPGSPAARGINLGYYRPMSGNARQAQAMTYADPNDPRIFRGPLAAPPAAPPATQTIPPTATASVPPVQTAQPDLAQRVPQNQWPQPPVRPTGWPFNQ